VSGSNEEARALRVMIDELRAEEPPELRWDQIERSLMLEVARRERARIGRSGTVMESAFGRVFAFAAAAAMLALGVSSMTRGSALPRPELQTSRVVDAERAPLSGQPAGERDLLSLREGDVIEAGESPVRFGHEGALSWTLEPGSRVRVRAMGQGGVGHTVALERGSIRAEVTPRDPSEGLIEAFAVEVEHTRVAVHGTAFSVRREGDRAIVDVEHGAVAVGPRGNAGITTGHLLIGPRRASFSLDGARSARLLPSLGESPRPTPLAALEPRPAIAPAHAAPVDRPELPASPAEPRPHASSHLAALDAAPKREAAPPPEPVAAPTPPEPPPPAVAAQPPLPPLTVSAVQGQLDQCFNRVYSGGSSSVKVSLSADIHLVLEPDGRVQVVRFSPPLEPAFQNCAVSFIGRSFAEGGKTVKIPISFHR
jgi:hypothetical protein